MYRTGKANAGIAATGSASVPGAMEWLQEATASEQNQPRIESDLWNVQSIDSDTCELLEAF
jgi:hypothetical protein